MTCRHRPVEVITLAPRIRPQDAPEEEDAAEVQDEPKPPSTRRPSIMAQVLQDLAEEARRWR